MIFPVVLACTTLAVFVVRNPLRAHPTAFYAAAVMADALFLMSDVAELPRCVEGILFTLMRTCDLALALFFVVMAIGALPRSSRARRWLQPIRAELSLVAWILSFAHAAVYLRSYASRLMAGSVDGAVLAALFVAGALTALLSVLGITSLRVVKRGMDAGIWKRVQRLAYPFFALVYVHLMLMLLPPAVAGGMTARWSVVVYTALFAGYALARLGRAIIDRNSSVCRADASNRTHVSCRHRIGGEGG